MVVSRVDVVSELEALAWIFIQLVPVSLDDCQIKLRVNGDIAAPEIWKVCCKPAVVVSTATGAVKVGGGCGEPADDDYSGSTTTSYAIDVMDTVTTRAKCG